MGRQSTTLHAALAGLATLALCGSASADDAAKPPGCDAARLAVVSKAPAFFFKVALGTRSAAQARSDMAMAVALLDEGAKGTLLPADGRTSDLVRLAALRASKAEALLAYDTDDKGYVVRADVERSVRASTLPPTGAGFGDRVTAVMHLDLDGDGRIDFAEMRHLTTADTLSWVEGPVWQLLRSYGPDGVPDATVTDGFSAFLDALDLDGDGVLSPAERTLADPYDAAARKRVASRPPPRP